MAKGANQKIRILYLMKILYEETDSQKGLRMDEIIGRLSEYGIDSERKTIYDDIDTLRLFGMDIEKVKEGGSVQYQVMSRDFEMPELKLLVDAVQSSKFITHKKSEELIKKIENFCSHREAMKLQRQVFVHNRIKTMNESIYYAVDYIHDAIHKNVKVSFRYFGWNEKKEKIYHRDGQRSLVSPWALTWDDENYYMIGFDSDAGIIKHYRVDKMESISLSEEVRDGGELFKGFDMALYSKKTFGMYGGREERVTLRCKNSTAGIIIDRFGTDPVFLDGGEGYFLVSVKVSLSPNFYGWLAGFGGDIVVSEPTAVKDEFRAHLEKTLNSL